MLLVPAQVVMSEGIQGPEDVQTWRNRQHGKMLGERSPFAAERVVNLEKDINPLGSSPDASILVQGAGIPPLAGEVVIRAGKAFLVSRDPGPGRPRLLVNGTFETEHLLTSTDLVSLGPYRLQLRRPGGAFAIRVANLESKGMRSYHGLKYFPFDGRFRVSATFTPAPGTLDVTVESTHGEPQKLPRAGRLSFDLKGKGYSLDAFIDNDEPESLFVIFRDGTSGKETYGVGRYLYVSKSVDGRTVLDFNKAFNPLCAYGPLFSCPIPPQHNSLPLRVPVGEKMYEPH